LATKMLFMGFKVVTSDFKVLLDPKLFWASPLLHWRIQGLVRTLALKRKCCLLITDLLDEMNSLPVDIQRWGQYLRKHFDWKWKPCLWLWKPEKNCIKYSEKKSSEELYFFPKSNTKLLIKNKLFHGYTATFSQVSFYKKNSTFTTRKYIKESKLNSFFLIILSWL